MRKQKILSMEKWREVGALMKEAQNDLLEVTNILRGNASLSTCDLVVKLHLTT